MKAKPRYKASELYEILLNRIVDDQLELYNERQTNDLCILTRAQLKAKYKKAYPTLTGLIDCMSTCGWDVESAFMFLLETVASGNIGSVMDIPGAGGWDT